MSDLKLNGPAKPEHAPIIEKFVQQVLDKNTLGGRRQVEIKELEVCHYEGDRVTFVTLEVGFVGDEGTLAQSLTRDYRHVMIRSGGGITLMNGARAPRQRKDGSWAPAKKPGTIIKEGWWNAVHAFTK